MKNEIYIRNCRIDEALPWVSQFLSDLKKEMDDPAIYQSSDNGTVVFTDAMDNQDVLSIAFSNQVFESDIECAKNAFSALSKEVFCDPGDNDSNPNKWWEITENGENIIYRE